MCLTSTLVLSMHAIAQPRRTIPLAVNTQVVHTSTWQPKIHVTGKLLAKDGIVIKSATAGRITHIYFHSGDYVKLNTPLLSLDTSILTAQKKILQNSLRLSQIEYDRKNNLYKKKALSKSDLDIATTHLKSDQAKMEQIAAELAQAQIKAPFEGKLGLRKVSVGDYLVPAEDIVNLQSTDPIFVDFEVPFANLAQLRNAHNVAIISQAYPKEEFSGVVVATESMIQPGTQSLTVRAKLNNANGKLVPGAFVDVTVFFGKEQAVLKVPQTAIIYSAKGEFVYVPDGKTVHKTRVTLGSRDNKSVIIKNGLTDGQQIVTVGGMKLYEGATIFVTQSHHPKQKVHA